MTMECDEQAPLPSDKDGVVRMNLRLSTPFEPYGRYEKDVPVDLPVRALNSSAGVQLRATVGKALVRETARLLRSVRRADARTTTTAAERLMDEQIAGFLGTAPKDEFEEDEDELGDLALEMDVSLAQTPVERRWMRPDTPLAEQWACAVAAVTAAARSALPGSGEEDGARVQRARAMLVQTAEDFEAAAVRAVCARVAGVAPDAVCARVEGQDIVLYTPELAGSAREYERDAKALKKSFHVLSRALTAALTAAARERTHERDEARLVTTVPCAVLIEHCGVTVLATAGCAAAYPVADASARASRYLAPAHLRDAATVPGSVDAVEWTPSRTEDDDDELPRFCFVVPNWRLLEHEGEEEVPTQFVRPELAQCGGGDACAAMAKDLEKWPRDPALPVLLEEMLHMNGVCLRDMNKLQHQLGTSEAEQRWARRIRVEMTARAFHKVVGAALRAHQQRGCGITDVVARHVVAEHFNALLSTMGGYTDRDGEELWRQVQRRCTRMFGTAGDGSDLAMNPGTTPGSAYTVLLLRRASELLGIEWRPATAAILTDDAAFLDVSYRVTPADIAALHPRVKRMHWVLHAQALLAQAQHRASGTSDGDNDGGVDDAGGLQGHLYFDYDDDDDDDENEGSNYEDEDEQEVEDKEEEEEDDHRGRKGRRQCGETTGPAGEPLVPGKAELLAALQEEPRCVATLRALGRCYREQYAVQRQPTLQCFTELFLVKAIECDRHDARALLDTAVQQDQLGEHQRARRLCLASLDEDPASPAALTLCGDLALVPNFRPEPAEARRCHLAAVAAAAARRVPWPHAKINHAVACLRDAAADNASATAAKDTAAVCALCEEAGAALLKALGPADSGAVPSAALLWDLAEYARVVLADRALSAALCALLALSHPRASLARAATDTVLSTSAGPASPAPPAASTDASQHLV